MTNRSDEAVVLFSTDKEWLCADGLGHRGDRGYSLFTCVGAGNNTVRLAGKEVGRGVFRAGSLSTGHGMPTNKLGPVRKDLTSPLDNGSLGTADIG